ncbi:MAG: hypothetical protein DRN17_00585 [Thermoplasmata archaeon]|nr:MAG: hypothetical protein DRN17_00585 [Thermoplasmata archaeon]
MRDNTTTSEAELIDCSIHNIIKEDGKQIRGIGADGPIGYVSIGSFDTQGSLEILQEHGDFLLISVYGDIPEFAYEYMVGDENVGQILAIKPKGNLFASYVFNPLDGSSTGAVSSFIPMGTLTGMGAADIMGDSPVKKINTFMISVNKSMDSSGEQNHVHMICSSGGKQTAISESIIDDIAYGSLRKKLFIRVTPDSTLLSVSTGNIQTRSVGDNEKYILTTPAPLLTLMESEYNETYKAGFRNISRLLEFPNKIYDTEGTI